MLVRCSSFVRCFVFWHVIKLCIAMNIPLTLLYVRCGFVLWYKACASPSFYCGKLGEWESEGGCQHTWNSWSEGKPFYIHKKKNRPEMICEYVNTFNSITVQWVHNLLPPLVPHVFLSHYLPYPLSPQLARPIAAGAFPYHRHHPPTHGTPPQSTVQQQRYCYPRGGWLWSSCVTCCCCPVTLHLAIHWSLLPCEFLS